MAIIESKNDTVSRQEIPALIYEFIDTLEKIKNIDSVIEVCFANKLNDIYVVNTKR
ncbi:hypothetical protein IJ843_01505 [bacterium]|nr:hypothetical protein [bacterium]